MGLDSAHTILIALGATVFVLFCIIMLCAHTMHDNEYDYDIDAIDQNALLRENLADTEIEEGKTEWQCIVCVHMNHPDNSACNLCGTAADST